MMTPLRCVRLPAVALALAAVAIGGPGGAGVSAGVFTFAGGSFGTDVIMHQSGLDPLVPPAGGVLTVTVGARRGDFNDLALQAIVQVIDTINAQAPTTGNVLTGAGFGMPFGAIDFESTLLHEMGHALGLAHPNLAVESGLPAGPDRDYAKSLRGPDGDYDLGVGGDRVRGTADDVRGDDINLNWRNALDNPFVNVVIPDTTTWFRPDAFTNIGTREVADLAPYPDNTEAVMVQGASNYEVQRTLVADDVAMLGISQAGFDGIAGTGDDYTLQLVWAGEFSEDYSSEDVDIWIQWRNSVTSFAVTFSSAAFYTRAGERLGEGVHACGLGIVHERVERPVPRGGGFVRGVITDADIFLSSAVNWHFGEVQAPCPGDATGDESVDFADLNLVLDQWATVGPEGDVDGSGLVDFGDLNEVLDHWGDVCP